MRLIYFTVLILILTAPFWVQLLYYNGGTP